jgi:hypothetical protein
MRRDETTQVAQHLRMLGINPESPDDIDRLTAHRLARALRKERRAASMGSGYELLRHVVLARLLRRRRGR